MQVGRGRESSKKFLMLYLHLYSYVAYELK